MKSSLFWLIIIIIIWVVSVNKKEIQVKEKEASKVLQEKQVTMTKIATTKPSKQITELAKKNLGKPYVFGKVGPGSFDCSGFVYGMYKQVGVNLPRTSLNQSKIKGEKLSRESLKEGDLVFFDTALEGHVNHSGIYLGDSKFIHASSGKANSVTISSLDAWYKDKFKWGKRLNANK